MSLDFQPTLLGHTVFFETEEGGDEGSGMITDETPTQIYIESDYFTGWMDKFEYFNLLGVSV